MYLVLETNTGLVPIKEILSEPKSTFETLVYVDDWAQSNVPNITPLAILNFLGEAAIGYPVIDIENNAFVDSRMFYAFAFQKRYSLLFEKRYGAFVQAARSKKAYLLQEFELLVPSYRGELNSTGITVNSTVSSIVEKIMEAEAAPWTTAGMNAVRKLLYLYNLLDIKLGVDCLGITNLWLREIENFQYLTAYHQSILVLRQ